MPSSQITFGAAAARLCFVAALLAAVGCSERVDRDIALVHRAGESSAYVASLGNLRTGPSASTAGTELATFLFGVAPDPPLGFIKPMQILATDSDLWVCDGALQAILRYSPDDATLTSAALPDTPLGPLAIAPGLNGERLVASENGVLTRYSAQGSAICRYAVPNEKTMRVGGIACVGDEVWASNVLEHQIEIFDLTTGKHRRTIGKRGNGPGEFGFPLHMALGPDGNVYVVDMLNARVQVLSSAGAWIRDIGGPGDRIGRIGRPKSVAIGPDGTVFVVDAAAQCVHAFDGQGRPLLSFGGATDGKDALVLPAGIAIWSKPLRAERAPPASVRSEYYVLVAEQLVRPGLRVYAWGGSRAENMLATAGHQPTQARKSATRLASSVENPHWRPDHCTACHPQGADSSRAIDPLKVDGLCLSCHDGKLAIDEAHPIGRVAQPGHTRIPSGWPLVAGRIGCLTCHDIRKQCDAPQRRPAENPAVVRGFDNENPLATCTQCHISPEWRINPHRSQVAGLTSSSATCGYCHTSTARSVDATGSWEFDSRLRDAPTKLCLNCHSMHADPAPHGHLDKPVSDEMRRAMLGAERRSIKQADVSFVASEAPKLLPLSDGRVACSTCHNPHASDGPLAALLSRPFGTARSTDPADARKSLRVPHMQLCLSCHEK